jgi:hypothetical protein
MWCPRHLIRGPVSRQRKRRFLGAWCSSSWALYPWGVERPTVRSVTVVSPALRLGYSLPDVSRARTARRVL